MGGGGWETHHLGRFTGGESIATRGGDEERSGQGEREREGQDVRE